MHSVPLLVNIALALGYALLGVVSDTSEVAGRSLSAANLRARTGVSIVAIGRSHGVTSNPAPTETQEPGDRVAVIGRSTEIMEAGRLLAGRAAQPQPVGS